MAKQTTTQHRAISILLLLGTILVVIATWSVPDET
jgi:hypothetical protein